MLCFLCFCQSNAQPYYFRHYQVEAGLSNNTVTCSIQDKAGFLWFGTKEGLNRFDGYRFKFFKLDDTTAATQIPDLIYCLYTDARGTLWVGSQKGLYRFDAARERLSRVPVALPEVSNIQMDAAGQLWFTAAANLCRYNPVTNALQVYAATPGTRVTTLCRTADGALWFATADGFLKKFNSRTGAFELYNLFSHSPAASSNYIQKIYPASDSTIFVGTSGQGIKLFQIPIRAYKDVLTLNEDKTAIFVRDIVAYTPYEFWFATESGIFILHTVTGAITQLKKKALDPYSLSDNAVYTLCKDRDGGIWAGTYFGGVNYYGRQYAAFQKYFPDATKNSLSGSVVREICEDKAGNLWIGTEDAGLNKLVKKTGTITRFQPTGTRTSIAYSNIHGLLACGNDLWIGTFEHGLDVMDIRTGAVKKHYAAGPGQHDLKNNFIVCLLQTRSGQIFVGTAAGLYQYQAAHDGFSRVACVPDGLFISALIEDHDNTLWIGTHNAGVYYLNPATQQYGVLKNTAADANSLPLNTVNAMCEDSNNNVWFATEGGGLCRLWRDRKTISRYTTENGLPGNFVFKVVEDDKKMVWASTSKGLAQLDPASGKVTVFTKATGLLNDQFNYNSGYKDGDGILYFGSIKGMVAFRPGTFLPRPSDPPVYITGFQVHNQEATVNGQHGVLKKSVLYTKSLTLPYNESSFSIDVAALSYSSPEMTAYRYRMRGLETEWTTMPSNHRIYFTNLAPGQYTFAVKAAVDGHWGPRETTLHIRIQPPWWATAWAYLLYTAAGLLLFYYLVRSYHTHIHDQKEKEIYEAKLDFFTNITHELRTPLTLIKGPVENLQEAAEAVPEIQEDVATLDRATNRLLALINQILDFRKTETGRFALYFNRLNLTKLLQEEFAAFLPLAKKRKLVYQLQLPPVPVYAQADGEALQKIFSNLLSNAVKYAGGEIRVSLREVQEGDRYAVLEIRNDGPLIDRAMQDRIFEPFYRLKGAVKQPGSGIGLALARSLAELHGGHLYLKDGQRAYNTFVLLLPLQPALQPTATNNPMPRSLLKTN